jgi:hypothetical protein
LNRRERQLFGSEVGFEGRELAAKLGDVLGKIPQGGVDAAQPFPPDEPSPDWEAQD